MLERCVLQFSACTAQLNAQLFSGLFAFLASGAFLVNFSQSALLMTDGPLLGGGDTVACALQFSGEFGLDLRELRGGFVNLPADFLQAGLGCRMRLAFGG
ncbi:hypothetical protein QFZ94_008623 [Paraburkholderia sp. JPY465]